MPTSERRGLRQLDPAFAFLDTVFRLGGGLPLFFFAIPLGYMVGGGETSLPRAIFSVPFALLWYASGFICVPVLALCLLLLLTSEFPRVPLLFATFAACAWTGYIDRQAWEAGRGLLLGLGTVLGFLFLVRPYLRRANL
ncbi:hypothetical protein ACXR0O_25375 [Verrucomicrobiota bacterium sgz303538]